MSKYILVYNGFEVITLNPLFGTKHIILIIISLILIVLGGIFVRKLKFSTVCKSLFYVGICSETIKIFYYIIRNEETHGGYLPKTDLPIHLCSIQILFIALVCFLSNEKIKRFILSFMMPSCLLGGIAAILIATDSSRNGMWILTLQYFGYHIAIVVFALYLLTSKEIQFTIKDYFSCLKFLVLIMFFAIYINSIVYDGTKDVNFMYVASPPQKGLPFLNEDHGWFVYIIHYTMLVIFCVTACYIKPIIDFIKKKVNNQITKKGH